MEDQDLAKIIELITQRTGIIPRDSHIIGIKNYINKRLKELPQEKDFDYYKLLCASQEEMIALINSATVNETYFFREEAQFQLLKDKIFPELRAKLGTSSMRIWSLPRLILLN